MNTATNKPVQKI